MARSRRDRFLRPHSDDDWISALPDDLVLLVLRRLDTRGALRAGMLSTHWARLPLSLPALDFRVGDILPPRYHRWLLLHRDTGVTDLHYQVGTAKAEKVMPHIRRYERRAMRALTGSVESFLDADVGRSRRVSRLRRVEVEDGSWSGAVVGDERRKMVVSVGIVVGVGSVGRRR